MSEQLLLGAVAYDPKVVTIWEAIRGYFAGAPVGMDYVLFSNYDAQVDALLAGSIDVAWNTNLAYVRTELETGGATTVLGMRDTDLGFTTLLVGDPDTMGDVTDIGGKTVAFGSADSAQAAIMPRYYLAQAGLRAEEDFSVLRFDSDVGKHGDTGRSEREALRAVLDGDADAAAVATASWDILLGEGEVPPQRVAPFWQSPPYAHCNFTALSDLDRDLAAGWWSHLAAMSWEDPAEREILVLEGLRQWVPPQLDGYRDLFAAVDEQGISDRW